MDEEITNPLEEEAEAELASAKKPLSKDDLLEESDGQLTIDVYQTPEGLPVLIPMIWILILRTNQLLSGGKGNEVKK